MDFLQRRGHLFTWICIAIVLGIGFISYAYHALQAPFEGDIIEYPPMDSQRLDSLYIERLDMNFLLAEMNNEKYMEVAVNQELPVTSIKVFQDSQLLGIINSRDIYYFPTRTDSIGQLKFVDVLTQDSL